MNSPRKRSTQIRLVLIGSLASGAFVGCEEHPARDAQRVYPNDYYVEGIGYYHAPFGNWYQYPYNTAKALQPGQPPLYYFGGQWGPHPYESIVNLSAPNADGLRMLNQVNNSNVSRGGFGRSYHSYGGHSFFS